MDFEKIIAKIRTGKTWRFHGGIHPAEHKKESSETPIERLEPASVYIVPVRQHSGDAGTVVVKIGDHVRKGDPLTRSSGRRDLPVSAPTSGTIAKIGLHTAPHQSGLEDLEITITPDGKDEWRERHPIGDFRTKSPEELLSIIHNAGIAGMALIPAKKLTKINRRLRSRIPGVTLIPPEAAQAIKDAVREDDDIIVRVLETRYPTGAARPLIRRLTGIEVGYTSRSTDFGIEMQNVATTYAIKRAVEDDEPLVERIVTVTGKNFGRKGNFIVPFGTPVRHILDKCGWHGEAKNELILGGPMMGFTVPTPDVSVTKTINCVFSPDSTEVMSYDNPLECIRCGRCARVCPSRLLPFALVKAAKAGDSEAIQRERIRDCIECGCCAFVCPSRIPLVRYIRIAKARLREEAAEARKKQNTERLIAEKLSREEKIAAARKARIAALREGATPKTESSGSTASGASPTVTAAGTGGVQAAASESAKPKSAALAAALARAKAAKAKNAAESSNGAAQGSVSAESGASQAATASGSASAATAKENGAQSSAAGSTKSKALAAELARAKAKKAAESGSSGAQEAQSQTQDKAQEAAAPLSKPAVSAKSAAVAAALAKARARKAAESSEADKSAGSSAPAPAADPKKAAIAAALAKAMARKAQESGEDKAEKSPVRKAEEPAAAPSAEAPKPAAPDLKKAALAAALARARAKKQAEDSRQSAPESTENPAKGDESGESAGNSGSGTSSAEAPASDPRKAAVAAALARARAKKQALTGNSKEAQPQDRGEEQAPSEENK